MQILENENIFNIEDAKVVQPIAKRKLVLVKIKGNALKKFRTLLSEQYPIVDVDSEEEGTVQEKRFLVTAKTERRQTIRRYPQYCRFCSPEFRRLQALHCSRRKRIFRAAIPEGTGSTPNHQLH